MLLLNDLAWLYTASGDPRAVAIAERAYGIAPENVDVHDTFGWALLAAGDPHRALELLETAIDLDPQDPLIQYHVGIAYAELERDREAARHLRRALAHDAFPDREAAESALAGLLQKPAQ